MTFHFELRMPWMAEPRPH